MRILFPCPYGIDHMRTMNEALVQRFPSLVPLAGVGYGRWKDSRNTRRGMLQRLYRTLESIKAPEVFFSNLLADATVEMKERFPKMRLYGYVHGTNLTFKEDALSDRRKIAHERAIYRATDAMFVGSRYFRDLLVEAFPEVEGKVFVVGFPFTSGVASVDGGRDRIVLYNHRLDRNKQPRKLAELKALLPRDFSFVSTSSNFDPFTIGYLKKAGVKTYVNPRPIVYDGLLNSAMFQVSFALHETFGVATQRAVIHGAFALAPKRASYPEFLPGEMLYEDLEELAEKIRYYADHPSARRRVIREVQQRFIRRFSAPKWLEKVERNL